MLTLECNDLGRTRLAQFLRNGIEIADELVDAIAIAIFPGGKRARAGASPDQETVDGSHESAMRLAIIFEVAKQIGNVARVTFLDNELVVGVHQSSASHLSWMSGIEGGGCWYFNSWPSLTFESLHDQ